MTGSDGFRVLHVVSGLSLRMGGPSKAALQMCEALAKRGVDVSLYGPNLAYDSRWLSFKAPAGLDAPLDTPVEHDGMTIHYFPTRWPHRFAFSPLMKTRLRQRIPQFDIVHIHSLYLYPTLVAAHYARSFNVPYLIRPHGTLDPYLRRRHRWRKALYNALIERANLDQAAAIHYTSTNEMRGAAPLKLRAQGVVIPLGIAEAEFANLPARGKFRRRHPYLRDKRLVVFLGRLSRKKGLDLLIPALARVMSQIGNVHLVIAGPDDEGYGTVVRQLLTKARIEQHVTIAGMVEGGTKLELLVDADVWVLPSRTENFGIAVLEAMACGLPIVISDRVDIHEEVEKAKAGLIVACDIDEIADAVVAVLSNPSLGDALGRSARELATRSFGWEAVSDQLLATYLAIARRRGGGHLDINPQSASEVLSNVGSR